MSGPTASSTTPDLKRVAARLNVGSWIAVERREYADAKYGEDTEARHKLKIDMQNYGLAYDGEWYTFISNYLRRAQLIGVDTMAGRQLLGKLAVTILHALETAVEVHGPMPKPGVPSGEVEEWVR